ncbi:MAG TPA: long-chain fatty acid--CoA ligase [Xanthobacteraceae bacterium]|nr:long-chain fatty acid--CoA ligase [Xanthobacteraceae bacterium]
MLEQEVARRAAVLSQNGIGRGAPVVIAHDGSAHFFADLLAVWTLGATAICLDSGLTEAEFRTLIAFAAPAAILVEGNAVAADPLIPVLRLAGSGDAPMTMPAWALNDPALVLFTSGTTGAPKGVVLTFRALLARWSLNVAVIGERTLARTLVTLPTHFGHGLIGNALTSLLAGGTIVLYARGMPLARELGRIVDKEDITFMSSVPALWQMALKLGNPPAGDSLTRVHIGSAPLAAELWSDVAAWSRAEIVNCYGMTETANWISGASSKADGIEEGLVGKVWGGAAAVVNERGERQALGEGEIVLQSPSLMAGYFGRPDLSAEVLRDGWFHTGDRGSIDADGKIRLTGRIKDEINRAGFKVQPAEIDRLLESHPAVAQACVFAIPDTIGGESVAAAIRLAEGASENAESLRSWCELRLRREAIPGRWFIVRDLPHNARGKVDRNAVRRMLVKDAAK